jgi:hypothetical protein
MFIRWGKLFSKHIFPRNRHTVVLDGCLPLEKPLASAFLREFLGKICLENSFIKNL